MIKHAQLIPVDRTVGAEAFAVALQRLREDELVGLHPEATITRSFELREFKTGAARMALEAQVPLTPMIVWGAHRIWPKPKFLRIIQKTCSATRFRSPWRSERQCGPMALPTRSTRCCGKR